MKTKALMLVLTLTGCSSCATAPQPVPVPQVTCRCEPCPGDPGRAIPPQHGDGIQTTTTNVKVPR